MIETTQIISKIFTFQDYLKLGYSRANFFIVLLQRGNIKKMLETIKSSRNESKHTIRSKLAAPTDFEQINMGVALSIRTSTKGRIRLLT